MYSPAVGPCSAAFSAAIRYSSQSFLRPGLSNTATQAAFIVTTKPTSIAGQLSAVISLGAAISIATDKAILTISQRKNPNTAVPGFREENLPVNPRANTAAGMTTAIAP